MARASLAALRTIARTGVGRTLTTSAPACSALVAAEDVSSFFGDRNSLLVDTASFDAYMRAHIPGAMPAPIARDLKENQSVIGASTFAMLAQVLHLTKEKTVLFYDDANMTVAARFWWVFTLYGHVQTKILDGGWQAYVRSGGAVSIDPPGAHPSNKIEAPTFQRKWLASKEDVLDATSRGAQLVDARTAAEYTGVDTKRNIRGGHVPGAININHTEFLRPDGRLKPQDALASMLSNANVDLSKPTITYCQAGIRASLAAFAIHQAGGEVAVYDGSMGDWLNDPSTPVHTGAKP